MGSRKLSGIEQLVDDATAELQSRSARIAALEATERELREAVKVLATEVVGNAKDRAVGKHWDAEINDAVWANPIAAAAVREASNG